MVKIPEEVRTLFTDNRVIAMGTSTKDGTPNTVYIGSWWWRDDETVLVVDNFFKKTRKNLEENPIVSLVVWDRIKQASYQLKGNATLHTEGEDFDNALKIERDRTDMFYPCKAIVLIHIEEVYEAMYGEGAGDRIV
ncbi:MAG: pyridoxamine 5'-phosphate oxidase family protein [Candidatus Bathyarchaeota archaeon]|nr:pyridoxamine 5'-phosphate oxidase family protein [Candidatus Bathyarchaeota archaeon]